MSVHKVFPANSITWVRVDVTTSRAVPVPCIDLTQGRHMRVYPVASTQLDQSDGPWSTSVQWRRFLIEDVDGLGELPLMGKNYSAAIAAAEAFARHIVEGVVDPSDPGHVSGWTLRFARHRGDDLVVIRERLSPPSAPHAAPPAWPTA